MTAEEWHHQLEVFQRQVEMLRSAISHPTQWSVALKDAVEAMQTSLEELHVAGEELQQQHALSRRLLQAPDLQTLLEAVLDAALRVGGATKGTIQLVDAHSGALQIVVQRGFDAPFLAFFSAPHAGEAACGVAMQRGARVVVEDVTQSAIFVGTPALEVLLAADVRAVQSTPLISHTGGLLGMFSTHYPVPHRPSDRELRFLDLLAQQAADAIARTQAEAARHASEARFRTMADAAPVLLWMAGLDMGCTYFNDGWLAFTGRTMDQERGDGWAEGVHPDDYARCVATYQTAFAARQPFEMEYRLRRADGLYRWVFDRGVPLLEPEGRFVGYIGSAIDITELRQAQEELERRVQERTTALARANTEMRRVTDMVSQDLRAPLITLQGFARELRTSWDVLQATLPALLPQLEAPQRADVSRALGQDIPEALGFIETSVTRMDHLIGAIVEVAHPGHRTLH